MPHLTLHIPTPCTQNWHTFTPNGTGRHCSQCCKTVIDYTQLNDKDLNTALALQQNQNPGNICGRFTPSQLNREIYINTQPYKLHKILAGLLIIGTTQTGLATEAQAIANATNPSIEIVGLANRREAPTKPSPKQLPTDSTKYIEGTILDEAMNPIGYASVYFKDQKIGVTSNSKGQFKIQVPNSYKRKITIQVSAAGYEPKLFSFSKKQLPVKSNLTLKLANDLMGEIIIVRSDD